MALPRLAVDLSGGLIRVVEGALGGPLRCGSGGTAAGSIVGGRVIDASAVGAALRQLLARTEIGQNRAMIAVSDAVATFRVFNFPGDTNDRDVDAYVNRQLLLDPERIEVKWADIRRGAGHRPVYAAAWDRSLVKGITEAARFAGLEAAVIELKSASLARVVAAPSYAILEVSPDSGEIFLIDGHLPQVWHSFEISAKVGEDLTAALAGPLQSVLRFYKGRPQSIFGPSSPIMISGEPVVAQSVMSALSKLVGHPVEPVPAPARVPTDVRHGAYLTCLGLLMRRTV